MTISKQIELSLPAIQTITDTVHEVGGTVLVYSGRGMYGEYCPAFEGNDIRSITSFFMRLFTSDDSEVVALARSLERDYRVDDMGLGIVCYFPRYSAVGFVEDDYGDDE